jgi:hypothetical protein
MLVLGAMKQISNETRIGWNGNAGGILHGPHRGEPVDIGANATGALHKVMGIARISADEHHFDSPEHLAGAPGVRDLSPLDFHLDSQMTFYPGDGIYRDSLAHGGLIPIVSC